MRECSGAIGTTSIAAVCPVSEAVAWLLSAYVLFGIGFALLMGGFIMTMRWR